VLHSINPAKRRRCSWLRPGPPHWNGQRPSGPLGHAGVICAMCCDGRPISPTAGAIAGSAVGFTGSGFQPAMVRAPGADRLLR
jgi:hypothetical protein